MQAGFFACFKKQAVRLLKPALQRSYFVLSKEKFLKTTGKPKTEQSRQIILINKNKIL
jgi:hypothetical protein